MNVAICYYGQPRTFKSCVKNHKETFWGLYNIQDVFAQVWWSPQSSGKQLEGSVWSQHHYKEMNVAHNDTLNELTNLLNPKSIRFDEPVPPKIFGLETIPKQNSAEWHNLDEQSQKDACLYSFFSMYTAIKRVAQLVEDYINIYGKYDWIMLCRYDVVFHNNQWPDLTKFSNEGFFNWDSFFCLRPEAFFKWCSQINWFFKYKDEARRSWVTGEEMQQEFCAHQMDIFDENRFVRYDLDHYFDRGNGKLLK